MLKFIGKPASNRRRTIISIHPMLKFITAHMQKTIMQSYFNTSHVKVYLLKQRYAIRCVINFNTSHVKVYLLVCFLFPLCNMISIHPMLKFIICPGVSVLLQILISIHPMLKFITLRRLLFLPDASFNTSHVKVYPHIDGFVSVIDASFNTSHVKVYPTHFLHFIQSTISDFSVFINILKIFTSRRTLCQKIHKIVAMSLFLRIHAILH